MESNYRLGYSETSNEMINIQLKQDIHAIIGKDGKVNVLDKKVTEVVKEILNELKNKLAHTDLKDPQQLQARLYKLTLVKTLIDLRQEQLPKLSFIKSLFSGLKGKVGAEAKAYNELLPKAREIENAAKLHNQAIAEQPALPKAQENRAAPPPETPVQKQAAAPQPQAQAAKPTPPPETPVQKQAAAPQPQAQAAKPTPPPETPVQKQAAAPQPQAQAAKPNPPPETPVQQQQAAAPKPQAQTAKPTPQEEPRSPISSAKASYSQPGQVAKEDDLDFSPTDLRRADSDSSGAGASLSDEEDNSPESSVSQPGREYSHSSTSREEGELPFTAKTEQQATNTTTSPLEREASKQEVSPSSTSSAEKAAPSPQAASSASAPSKSVEVEKTEEAVISTEKKEKEARVLAKTLKEFLTNAGNDIKTFDNYLKLFEGVQKFKAFNKSSEVQQFIKDFTQLRESAKFIYETIKAHNPPDNSTDPEQLLKSATNMAHQLATQAFAPFVQATSQITVQADKIKAIVKKFEDKDSEDITKLLEKDKHKELKELLNTWNTGSFTQALGSAISQPQAKMLKYPLLFRELSSSVQKNRSYHPKLTEGDKSDTMASDEAEIKRLCGGVNQSVKHTEIIGRDGKDTPPQQIQEVNVAQMNMFLTDAAAGKIRFTDGGILIKVPKGTTSGLLDAKKSAEKLFAMIDPKNPQQNRKLAFMANFDENLAKEMKIQMAKARQANNPELTIRAASYEQAVNEVKRDQVNQDMISDIEKELEGRPTYINHEKLRLDQNQKLTLDVSSQSSTNEEKSTNKTAEALLEMLATASTEMQIKIIKTVDAADPALKTAFNKKLTSSTFAENVQAIRENEASKRKARTSYLG